MCQDNDKSIHRGTCMRRSYLPTLIVGELNSFVIVVLLEADTVDALIVSGLLTVEAEPAKRCRSFVFCKRQGYKNYHRHNRILLWFHLR